MTRRKCSRISNSASGRAALGVGAVAGGALVRLDGAVNNAGPYAGDTQRDDQ